MRPQWETLVEPLLAAVEPDRIVEIGAAAGATTLELLRFASEHDAVVEVIDPVPRFDVEELEVRFDGHFRFHQARSHDVLPSIEPADAVLIDGDHNWYTVHGELTRIEQRANEAGRHFPVVILHDVMWPYARRDMYYDPEAIPAEWRQPWARRPIVWGQRLLGEGDAGLNGHLANALEEGTERNGVLTAVEDFVEWSDTPLRLHVAQVGVGIGVLAPTATLEQSPAFRARWDELP